MRKSLVLLFLMSATAASAQTVSVKAMAKSGKKYPALSPLVRTGEVPVDKKLF